MRILNVNKENMKLSCRKILVVFRFFVITFSLLGFSGCREKFNLDLGPGNRFLVVEGNIFNTPGPYYVRLTWSRPALSSIANHNQFDKAEPVKNAFITIGDNAGNTDTLRPAPDSLKGYLKFYRTRNQIDSGYREDELTQGYKRGFYQTNS